MTVLDVDVDVRGREAGGQGLWDRFVDEHPCGSPFHLCAWSDVVQEIMGHQQRPLMAWRGERLVGVLPLTLCTRPFGGANLISVPYAVYGGPLAEDAAAERALLEAGELMAREEAVGRLDLRCLEELKTPPGDQWVGSDLYVTFRRKLPETAEEVQACMPKKARAEVRKAREKHGLELCEGRWYAEDLARLFHRNKRALGSPGLPDAFFQALMDRFGERVTVHLVRGGHEVLAAVMSFRFGDTLLAYYSGVAPGADRATSASNFMYAALQEWAVEEGVRRFDFGRSRSGSGSAHFKAHQGFEATPLAYRHLLVRSSSAPSFHPSNPKTVVLQKTWRCLPSWLTRQLSVPLSRYLP
jgi:FemAB-related protein (PEP-CTERM system-associated)